jgi:hypothetical protein|tara:strand:+ start:7646 stop:7918 length:273 start_codon:yes stop_codon:yes gene_type:complete
MEYIMSFDFFDYDTTKPIQEKKHVNFDSKLADQYIKYCLQCKRCWELSSAFRVNKKNGKRNIEDFISYYVNFPTYGKQRRQCPRCKKENQ